MLGAVATAAFAAAAPAWGKGAAETYAALQGLIDAYVASGKVPGAVVAILRGGAFRPQYLTSGRIAFETRVPVSTETLWRIYSMTKPVTAMAVMQQIALGRLTLDTPIAEILPEFRSMRVLTDPDKSLASRPTDKPILVRHLLTHTAGFSYTIVGNGPLEKEYRRLGLMPGNGTAGSQPGDGAVPPLQTFVKTLATLPLYQEPGKAWRYSVAMDVAGALLERLTDKTLDKVFAEQLFAPLGMKNTSFALAERDRVRLSSNYAWVKPDLTPIDTPVLIDGPARSDWTANPVLLAGGAGLLSSAADYARFGQMLLNEGRFEGRTIMPRGIARLALSNIMPKDVFYDGNKGYGAGGSVTLFDTLAGNPGGTPVGHYGWGGAAGTKFFVDPVRQIAVVVMLQFLPSNRFPLNEDLALAVNKDLAGTAPWDA
jgi:CubicO group peptidase (beta-lactamase class C family)